jgi:hypothetical protein
MLVKLTGNADNADVTRINADYLDSDDRAQKYSESVNRF